MYSPPIWQAAVSVAQVTANTCMHVYVSSPTLPPTYKDTLKHTHTHSKRQLLEAHRSSYCRQLIVLGICLRRGGTQCKSSCCPGVYAIVSVYACVCACMGACVCACVRACMHVCVRTCVRACMHVCLHVCVLACVRAVRAVREGRVWVHACLTACTHACVCV